MEKQKSIGAFWLKTAKSGLKYMSGKIDDKPVVMFKNNYKEEGDKTVTWVAVDRPTLEPYGYCGDGQKPHAVMTETQTSFVPLSYGA